MKSLFVPEYGHALDSNEKYSFIKISYGSAPSQFGVLYLSEKKKNLPVIVMIHGGFWRMPYGLDQLDELAVILAVQGYAVWNIEYRRVGEPGGGYPGTFQDAIDSLNILNTVKERYSLDLSHVIVLGHSAGGHLALWLASRSNCAQKDYGETPIKIPIQGVISLAGIPDMEEMWKVNPKYISDFMGGTPGEFPERYQYASPIQQLPSGILQILVHGDADEEVPIYMSRKFYEKAISCGDPVELKVFSGCDHFALIAPHSEVWRFVMDRISRILYDL